MQKPRFELTVRVTAELQEDGTFDCWSEITSSTLRGQLDVRQSERDMIETAILDLNELLIGITT